jgi:hypothetical protein
MAPLYRRSSRSGSWPSACLREPWWVHQVREKLYNYAVLVFTVIEASDPKVSANKPHKDSKLLYINILHQLMSRRNSGTACALKV